MTSAAVVRYAASTLVLGLLPAVLAHGEHNELGQIPPGEPKNTTEYPPTYFAHADHVGVIYTHIALMTLAWVFILPVAVVLSLARSRHTLVSQLIFTAVNSLGLFFGVIYNSQTPDLYPKNAHHSVGWTVTSLFSAQVLIGVVRWISGALGGTERCSPGDNRAFHLVPTEIQDEEEGRCRTYEEFGRYPFSTPQRASGDSGQGTEPNTESLRSTSSSSIDEIPLHSPLQKYEEKDEALEDIPLSTSAKKGYLASRAEIVVTSLLWKYVERGYRAIDRIILPFGFIAFTTGIVTFGRFFEGQHFFNGLAHWVKGGVFFWLGLFTLGRWTGSFGDLGWAWNIRPRGPNQKWCPSAEFVESALIFFYGSTNIFLEHLSDWGGEWSATDMEHISITVLFIGGGLCGMLVESTRIRELLNTTVIDAASSNLHTSDEAEESRPPKTYKFSLNPIPALVILLLGIMMSSHTQASMVSSMIHKQWGNLLLGASLARALTYALMFLKPPTSIFPSRPPTELLSSFGLISGGIIFMASSEDTVDGMIHYGLDEMFMHTVTMGLVGLLMAWEVIVLALKGWAVRREQRAKYRGLS